MSLVSSFLYPGPDLRAHRPHLRRAAGARLATCSLTEATAKLLQALADSVVAAWR